MSVVGGNYQYDLFFSYAWAEKANGAVLRDWSRMVADKITQLVGVRFNSSAQLAPYLDRDVNTHTGIQLDASLRAAAESAAIFVAMISPYYKSDYCQKELNWFLDRSTNDGAKVTERLCLYLVQDGDDLQWPDKLREPSGSRLLYTSFYGEGGLPLDIAAFINGAPTPLLAEPIRLAVLEIGSKIKELRDKLDARVKYEESQRRPFNPVVFLEAEKEDEMRWAERRRQLEAANIILPATAPPTPATAVPNPGATYSECDGIVLLRSRPDDDIGSRIKKAYQDRRQIDRDEEKGMLPWALLDELDDPPPGIEEFKIPRVVTRGDWVPELQQKLRGA